MPGSIAALESLELGGQRQWVVTRGRSVGAPLLLFLAGGPGISELGWVRTFDAALEDHFVVVTWEQRGAGKSFRVRGRNRDALTPAAFVADTIALTERLRARFAQERVLLVGHSWGSLVGALAAARRPDLFSAFVGVGQLVAPTDNDRNLWHWARREATVQGRGPLRRRLARLGPPPWHGPLAAWRYTALSTAALLLDPYPPNPYTRRPVRTAMATPEYTFRDRCAYLPSMLRGLNVTYPQVADVDLRRDVASLGVPVTVVMGAHDHETSPALAREWLDGLDAPRRRYVTFDASGHAPCFEEPERFVALVRGLDPS